MVTKFEFIHEFNKFLFFARVISNTLSAVSSILFPKIPINLVQSSYTLVVSGTGGGVSFFNSTSVDVQTKSLSCFIQTDKATYKPGQRGKRHVMITVKHFLQVMGVDYCISIANMQCDVPIAQLHLFSK